MSGLPEIYNPNPIVIPAQEAKPFPNGYCREFYVYPPTKEGTQALVAMFRPYNRDTKELYPSDDKDYKYSIDDIFTEADRAPLLAEAMAYIVYAMSLSMAEKDLTAKIAALEDGPEKDALVTQLAGVQAALGIVS